MSPAQALFQAAAVLIPALLFAGGLARQSDDAAQKWYGKLTACAMVLVVIAAVGGELVSINGAFAVSSSQSSIQFVVGVLAVGTAAIGLRTARHWVDGVLADGHVKAVAYVLGLAIAAVAVVATENAVTTTIHDAQAAQALTALQAATDSAQAAQTPAARAAGRSALATAQHGFRAACRQAPDFAACGQAPR